MANWKEVKGFEGLYEVSDQGQVRSIKPSKSFPCGNHILKPVAAGKGYKSVHLYLNKKSHSCYIHHLVMDAFVGPRPQDAHINHKDADKANNHVTNLEYCTPKENTGHAFRLGLMPKAPDSRGSKNPRAKINEQIAIEIDSMLKQGIVGLRIAEHFSVSSCTVYNIKHRKLWAYLFEEPASALEA